MTDPEHASPGRLVSELALDAVAPLHALLHVPPDDGNLGMHRFLKEAVEYSGFAESHRDLWPRVVSYAEATLDAADRRIWLDWVFNAFTGLHPPDVDLSGWLMALDRFVLPDMPWAETGMTPAQIAMAEDFVSRYFGELDEPAFIAAIEECRARPLTEWDKRMHQAYGFVYFDRSAGADPFLSLKFANQGESLRRVLATYDFAGQPDFPHRPMLDAAQGLIDRRGVWMPPGRRLAPLTDVR